MAIEVGVANKISIKREEDLNFFSIWVSPFSNGKSNFLLTNQGLKHYEFEIKFKKQALNKSFRLITVTNLKLLL
jgi:hypothetical protein